jgi:hypothetical protein
MVECVRAGCSRPALGEWWLLCCECSGPLLHLDDGRLLSEDDQRAAAGWDALGWAERIAPACWGSANERDPWVLTVRTLSMAAVVTRRASGCPHTVSSTASVPVVAVARAVGVLRCPPCAEPVVAQTSKAGPSCDRCGAVTGPPSRVAALTGASMILVAQLCPACRGQVLELVDETSPDHA